MFSEEVEVSRRDNLPIMPAALTISEMMTVGLAINQFSISKFNVTDIDCVSSAIEIRMPKAVAEMLRPHPCLSH